MAWEPIHYNKSPRGANTDVQDEFEVQKENFPNREVEGDSGSNAGPWRLRVLQGPGEIMAWEPIHYNQSLRGANTDVQHDREHQQQDADQSRGRGHMQKKGCQKRQNNSKRGRL